MVVGDQHPRRMVGNQRIHHMYSSRNATGQYQSISTSAAYDLYPRWRRAAILAVKPPSRRCTTSPPIRRLRMNTDAATSLSMKSLSNDLAAIMPANAAFLAQPRKLLIDGAWAAAASGQI